MRDASRAILPRTPASDAFPSRLGRALQRGWLVYIDWRLRRLAFNSPHDMSDRQLEDIGLQHAEPEGSDAAGRRALLQARIC